jgi:hypothetical protein
MERTEMVQPQCHCEDLSWCLIQHTSHSGADNQTGYSSGQALQLYTIVSLSSTRLFCRPLGSHQRYTPGLVLPPVQSLLVHYAVSNSTV